MRLDRLPPIFVKFANQNHTRAKVFVMSEK